jgi:DNA-binding MarR family transcriptional regulator
MFERCLYFNLNALTRKVNKIWDQAFQDLGLSPSHAYLLRVVLATQGIANELKLEKSTITRFIGALESKGYLQRVKSGREQNVYPTKAATDIFDQLEQQGNALYQRMTKDLGESPLTKLVGELRNTGARLE